MRIEYESARGSKSLQIPGATSREVLRCFEWHRAAKDSKWSGAKSVTMLALTPALPMNQPTPGPSQEGSAAGRPRRIVPLLGGARGGFRGSKREIPFGRNSLPQGEGEPAEVSGHPERRSGRRCSGGEQQQCPRLQSSKGIRSVSAPVTSCGLVLCISVELGGWGLELSIPGRQETRAPSPAFLRIPPPESSLPRCPRRRGNKRHRRAGSRCES